MPAIDRKQLFCINPSEWQEEWNRRKPPKSCKAEEVGYFTRENEICIPHSRDSLHEYSEPMEGINLIGDDISQFR